MTPSPPRNWLRSALTTLLALAGLLTAAMALRRVVFHVPVVEVGYLTAQSHARVGQEVIVCGEWVTSGPSHKGGHTVLLRGRDGGRVTCHFAIADTQQRLELERRMHRQLEVAVRGRCAGVADNVPVLRDCCLLE